jgi:hypothetical protein
VSNFDRQVTVTNKREKKAKKKAFSLHFSLFFVLLQEITVLKHHATAKSKQDKKQKDTLAAG